MSGQLGVIGTVSDLTSRNGAPVIQSSSSSAPVWAAVIVAGVSLLSTVIVVCFTMYNARRSERERRDHELIMAERQDASARSAERMEELRTEVAGLIACSVLEVDLADESRGSGGVLAPEVKRELLKMHSDLRTRAECVRLLSERSEVQTAVAWIVRVAWHYNQLALGLPVKRDFGDDASSKVLREKIRDLVREARIELGVPGDLADELPD